MPLRLLHHRGLLPELLGLLRSSSFPHIAILWASYEVLRGQRGLQGLSPALGGGAGGQARARATTPRGESKAEDPTTGICGSDSCGEIPEVSGTVSCPEVTVNSEPVVLTSITMEKKGCG